jgi:hypothetical protein
MFGNRNVHDAPAFVRQEYQNEEHAACDRRHREEVHRYQSGYVIREKRSSL